MAKEKNPKKEPRKQKKTPGNPHLTAYQREREDAVSNKRRKEKRVQG